MGPILYVVGGGGLDTTLTLVLIELKNEIVKVIYILFFIIN